MRSEWGSQPKAAPAPPLLHSGPLSTVIVGYGRAGRELHHAALREAAAVGPSGIRSAEVIAVDPRRPADLPEGTRWVEGTDRLSRLAALDPDRTVFHLTTPPAGRLSVLRELLDLGARAVIVEKPFAVTHQEARHIAAAAASAGAHLIPVAVWPSSEVTRRLEEELSGLGPLQGLWMEQSKPRVPRADGTGDGHRSTFDVEMPHQLVLALHLAGEVEHIVSAVVEALPLRGRELPALGGARLVLKHRSGVVSELLSDFTVSQRYRSLTALAARGWGRAGYPLSAAHPRGTFESSRRPAAVSLPDRPLTRFLADAYSFLTGRSDQRPPGTCVDLHIHATALLESAARMAGVEAGPTTQDTTPRTPEEASA
ncbi:Gfo/Idh/MocA family oxidoreductase [Streptomyces sp. NPDC006235]|uniref:Gfo/Idh/MocA family oxidoreductase n=1 Tax=Streptomyces sp. NPDC006235 TaxID=3156736 RepID=UPI0033A934A9